jgi:hypothetical protein
MLADGARFVELTVIVDAALVIGEVECADESREVFGKSLDTRFLKEMQLVLEVGDLVCPMECRSACPCDEASCCLVRRVEPGDERCLCRDRVALGEPARRKSWGHRLVDLSARRSERLAHGY